MRYEVASLSSQIWLHYFPAFRLQGNNKVIQVYVPISSAEEAEVEWFCEDLQELLELTPKKRCPFHHVGLECKSRKSREIWSNRQI